jgi:hypothetical protein
VPYYDRVQQQAFAWLTPMGVSFVVKAVAAAESFPGRGELTVVIAAGVIPVPDSFPASDEPSVVIASAVIT